MRIIGIRNTKDITLFQFSASNTVFWEKCVSALEVNFDGLVGPTHNYAGLSPDNIASVRSRMRESNPLRSAKEGLFKMKALHDMGLVQGVIPPQARPSMYDLRKLGFSGSDSQVLLMAARDVPHIFNACCSASSMWVANGATVSPSADTSDARVHFTPANLVEKFHRFLESETTSNILKAIFNHADYFVHHSPLPAHHQFRDEGAANHSRFCLNYGDPGVELFVYGCDPSWRGNPAPAKFSARHTLEASKGIARLHRLDERRVVFAQQNPSIIDQGVFHNDVIAVGNQNVFFHHEEAFLNTPALYEALESKMRGADMHFITTTSSDIPVDLAVDTYLFNSQIVTLPSGEMTIIAPIACQENKVTFDYLSHLTSIDSPISAVEFFDLSQSMDNGGGPACLRLRVVLNHEELNAIESNVIMSDGLFEALNTWIDKHYRDRLHVSELHDPQLLVESQTALDELTTILNLGSVYPFQRM